MKKSAILSAALLVIAASTSPSTVRADSADATCQLRGPGTKGLSAPCTFSQRQGYIDVTLQGGGTYSFSPGKDSSHYTDKKGERVDRTLLVGDSQEFRWQDGRTLTVTYKAASTSGGGGGAAGAVAVADMSRYCAGEASAKFGVSPRDIKTENAKQTQGMYEVWGQYGANAQVFICSFNAERQFLSVDLYRP